MSANALHNDTAQLPKVTVTKPQWPFGKNTVEAINAGLYYSAISSLQEIVRRYAEVHWHLASTDNHRLRGKTD